jgi:hypothetical protein
MVHLSRRPPHLGISFHGTDPIVLCEEEKKAKDEKAKNEKLVTGGIYDVIFGCAPPRFRFE